MRPVKSDQEASVMNRRNFITKSVGYTAGLTLLTVPGILKNLSAAEDDKSKKEILQELGKKAEMYLPLLMSCSRASFAALNDQFKLKAANVIPALMPFTGGIAMRAETCGAVTGSILALGFFFESIKQQPGSSMKYSGLFFNRFTKEFTSTTCKTIQKHLYGRSYDFLNPEEQQQYMAVSGETEKNCTHLVKRAVQIAGDIILENS